MSSRLHLFIYTPMILCLICIGPQPAKAESSFSPEQKKAFSGWSGAYSPQMAL
jgi:hypothetical protein